MDVSHKKKDALCSMLHEIEQIDCDKDGNTEKGLPESDYIVFMLFIKVMEDVFPSVAKALNSLERPSSHSEYKKFVDEVKNILSKAIEKIEEEE